MKNKLVMIGCGGHARSVLDVYLFNNPQAEVVFVDPLAREGEKILNFPVLKDHKITDEAVFVAIGDNLKRAKECKKYKNLCSIISKNAHIGNNVKIGNGVFVAHNVHVGIESKIGDGSIINTSSSVDHEVTIGENCHIAPNTTICGRCEIGNNVFLGAGATVIDKIKICDNTTIGAGGVVVKDIDKEGTYVGVPVEKIK